MLWTLVTGGQFLTTSWSGGTTTELAIGPEESGIDDEEESSSRRQPVPVSSTVIHSAAATPRLMGEIIASLPFAQWPHSRGRS